MKQLDWYNELDVYTLARLEAGRFLNGDSGDDHQRRHFNILKDYYFDLLVDDFEEFRKVAEHLGCKAVREDKQD